MDNELNKVNQWLCTNRLSINLSKINNFVILTKIMSSNNFKLSTDNHLINQTEIIEF